ncbi:MAG: monomeric [Kiritimatiellae bacterium]|nr:monomeric [FeFe] hydrogenase [Kiritimatiellia bacterium]
MNAAIHIRRELILKIVKAFDAGELEDELDRIAIRLRPKDGDSSRCCVYHDRAVLKYRLMALLGVSVEDERDEAKTLKEYYAELLAEMTAAKTPQELAPVNALSVCGPACSGCPSAKVISTPNCRGCFARPCVYSCPKRAIDIVDGKSRIDESKCIKCGKCIAACPYHAIVKTTVPCEEACPVDAIKKNDIGVAEIDFDRCISCGKCVIACPFGAVMERSQLIEVLETIREGHKVVAMLAPSTCDQLPGTVEQALQACVEVGFSDAMEVALGAEMTTEHETAEFIERMEKDPNTLMTTSCCPAYVNLVAKHVPELIDKVSLTPSPMVFANELVKKASPLAKTVFVGPCVAKRGEARRKNVDFVLSVEELAALFAARGVKVEECAPMKTARPANPSARNYSKSCGVTEAVLEEATAKIPGFKLKSKQVSGIDRKTCAMLKLHAAGKLPGNFIEVMACPGGCVNGPCGLKK